MLRPVLSLALLAALLPAGDASAQTPEEIDQALAAEWEAAQPDPRTLPHIASRKPFRRDLFWFQQRAYPLDYIPYGALEKTVEDISTWRSRPKPRGGAGYSGWGRPGRSTGWIMAGPSPINGGQTADNGNVSGRITSLAVDPGLPSHWYAGTAMGGVWHTTDAGATWQQLSDNMPTLAIGALAIAAGDRNVIYAGTGESVTSTSYAGMGVLKSIDAGATWTQQGAATFRNSAFSEIRIHPSNSNIVVAATKSSALGRGSVGPPNVPLRGIYRTTTGGADVPPAVPDGVPVSTWQKVFPPAGSAEATDLEADPYNFNNLYAAISNGDASSGVYRSTTAGETWDATPLQGPWETDPAFSNKVARIELAIAPADPNVMYVSIEHQGPPIPATPPATGTVADPNNGGLLGIWRTTNLTDDTPAWTKLPNTVADSGLGDSSLVFPGKTFWYNHHLSVDPADSRILYLAEFGLWKYDGRPGANPVWKLITGPLHADNHAMAWTVDTGAINHRLIEGNDGGVWYTDNRGDTWVNCNAGLAITQFYEGAIHPARKTWAIGGTQDNGTSLHQGTLNWKFIGGGDGADAAFSPGNPDEHWIISSQNQTIQRTKNAGLNWTDADGGVGSPGGITDNNDDRDNNGNLVATNLREPNNGPFIARIAVHPSIPDLVIAGTDNVWKSSNFFSAASQPTWTNNSPDTGPVSALAFAPSDGSGNTYAFATQTGALRITTAGGGAAGNWRDLDPSGQVPGRWVTSIVFDPRNANIVYVSLSGFNITPPPGGGTPVPNHLWKTGNALEASPSWVNVSAPVNSPHNCMTLDPAQPHVIYAGTDVGIWQGEQKPGELIEWTPIGAPEGLPNVAVFDLEFHRVGRRLFAFTHGRGLYVTDLAPAHDNMANAEQISGSGGQRYASNIGATEEAGEPAHYASSTGNKSVWYKWTTTTGGTATVSTSGSSFDTVLAVYELNATPDSWNWLDQPAIAADDESGGNKTSRLTFTAVSGKTYYIAVDGYNPDQIGEITLSWSIEDTVPPSAAVTTPRHLSFIQSFASLSGTADDNGGLDRVEVKIQHGSDYWNGTAWTAAESVITRPVSSGYWNVPNLPAGAGARTGLYTVRANAFDLSGQRTVEIFGTNWIQFTVDDTDPTGSVSGPGNGTVIDTQTFPFAGFARDNAGIERVILFIRRNADNLYWNGSTWVEDAFQANLPSTLVGDIWESAFTHPVPGPQMPNGSYNFIAIIYDKAGRYVQRDSQVTVDFHQVYTWTGATLRDGDPNNNSNFWGTAENWSPVGVPDVPDVAVIANGDRVDSTVSRTVYGIRFSSGTINFTSGPGPNGTLTTTNASTWTGGTVTGIWENQNVITVSGAAPKILWDGAVLNNKGTVIWEGDGTIRAQASGAIATINNKPGATFRMIADGSVFARVSTNYRPVFNNENGAVLEKQSSGGFSTLTIWEFRNAGEIRCGTGTLAFVDNWTDNYDLFLNPGTTLTGAGALRVNNATQLNTAVHALCVVEMVDGSQIAAPAAANVARFEGTLNWRGGVIVGNFTIGTAGVVNLSDAVAGTPVPKLLWDGAILNNEGAINWLGGGTLQSQTSGAIATVNNRALFNAAADGTLFSRVSSNYIPVFNNEAGGVFRKTAGSGTTLVNTFNFNHRGGMVCDTGIIAFNTTLDIASGIPWTGAGDYELQGGTTTVNGTMALNGPAFTILAGGVWGAPDGSGAFATTGGSSVEWKGGTFHRTLRLTAGSAMNLSGPEAKLLADNAVLDNDGTITWQGGGTLRAQASGAIATVNNRTGAKFHVATDGIVFDRASTNYTPIFNNLAGAKFTRTAGSGTATVHTYTFNNEGEIAVDTGVLAFNTTLNLKDGGALKGAGRFEMAGGAANVTGTTSLTGTSFAVLGGTIAGLSGAVWTSSAGGAWRWLGGTLTGTLEIAAGATLQIADPPSAASLKILSEGSVLNNKGLVSWSGAGALRANAAGAISTVNNRSGGEFQITADGPLFTRNSTNYVPLFNNDSGAVFVKPTGDAGIASTCDWRFHNAGTVQIGGGKFEMLQGGDSSGTFAANGAAFLRFTGGSHTLRSGTILTGVGRIQVDGGTVLGDGVLNGNTALPGAFEVITGILGGTTNYTGAGLFHWAGGTVAGTLTMAAGTRMEADSAVAKLMADGAVFNNHGTAIWKGDGTIRAQASGATGTINNKPGGLFSITADGTVFDRLSGNYRPVFNNENGAVLEKQSGGGTSTLTIWEYHNAGEIRCGTGTLAFVDNPSGYDLFLDPGTTLTGSGRLRLQTATQLTTAVNALCPVDLPENSWLGCPPPPSGPPPARFEGTMNWTGGTIFGVLTIGSAGVVNLSDAVAGTAVPKLLYDSTVLHNEGVINWLGGGTLQSQTSGAIATVNNRALFNAAADGTLFSRVSGNYTPVFNNEAGGVFRKTAGTGTTLVNTFHFNHRGGMVCDTGIIAFNTALDTASGIPWTGAGDFEMQGGSNTVNGTMALNGPAFTILAGDVVGVTDGSGAFATTGGSTVEWKGGTIHRTLRLTGGSSMNLSGTAVKLLADNAVLNNDGTMAWQGGGTLRAQASGGIATVNNRSGAQFHAAADGTVFDRASSNYTPTFNNAGSFRIGASPGSCGMNGWNFTQAASGALLIEVAGPALTEFDRLTLTSGGVTLGGALNVTKLNGYAPADGTTFAFLTASSRTGNFGIVNAPGFEVDYTPGGATLRAAPGGLTFDSWAASNGLTGANALAGADPDKDGLTNFAEYVFNSSPTTGGPAPQAAGMVTIGGQQWLTVNYRRWADREAAGVVYAPQGGGSLGGWSSTGIIDEADPSAPVIPGSTACRCRVLIGGATKFLRVMATKP